MVSEDVVMHRDRLARIGFELLEYIFSKFGTKLMVHCSDDESSDYKRGLTDALVAVTTLSVTPYNGRRATENQFVHIERSTTRLLVAC
jgi:predicted site-specific integrase-resolvase